MIEPIASLIVPEHLNDLGPGRPNLAVCDQLRSVAQRFAAKVKDRNFANTCYAGLWLLHDFHDESHAISQDLHTIEGSYWHGILHRREPDCWNAKYWFRRVPTHPIFAELATDSATMTRDAGTPTGSEYLLRQSSWDAAAFVDLCESAANGSDALTMLCRRIQRREWDLLFAYCYQRAFNA
jgi:hypothetical protein